MVYVIALLLSLSAAPSSLPLEPVRDVHLPGGPTRFDYQSVDAQKRRLYIAHLGSDELVVFVYVSNNRGVGLAVIDTRTNKALRGVDIGGGAGNSMYDPGADRVLVVSHGKPELVAVDPGRDAVVERYPLHGVAGCHGLLVDAGNRRAYVACGGDQPRLVAFDLAARKQIAALTIAPHPDVLAFDPALRRLYVSSSTGNASVFEDGAEGPLRKLGEGFVGPNTHTVAVDPRTHEVFFPIEDLAGHPVLRIMIPTDLPPAAKGTH